MTTPAEFIARWKSPGGAELANSQSYLKELCQALEVPEPDLTPPDESQSQYVFEKAVQFRDGDGSVSVGRIDLYERGALSLNLSRAPNVAKPARPARPRRWPRSPSSESFARARRRGVLRSGKCP